MPNRRQHDVRRAQDESTAAHCCCNDSVCPDDGGAARAARTWPPGDGFDLHAALAAAQPGDTIVVPAGVYAGPLIIDRPVTLVGEGMPVIEGTGKGDVVTITAPDVTLRGFVIRNSGDSLDQENAGVTGLAPNLTIESNRFEDTLFGVYLKEAPE